MRSNRDLEKFYVLYWPERAEVLDLNTRISWRSGAHGADGAFEILSHVVSTQALGRDPAGSDRAL
jgi:hypothetical protein